MEFVLDEVGFRLVDNDNIRRVGERGFETTGECQAGVAGAEDDDAHTGESAHTAKKGRPRALVPVDHRGRQYKCKRPEGRTDGRRRVRLLDGTLDR